MPLCMHNCTHLCSCTFVPALLRNRITLCSHALVLAQLHTIIQLCVCTFVCLCLHYCMQSCMCAVVPLCSKSSRAGRAKKPCQSCLYDGYAQQNLTHLLSLSHLLSASRSRETSSSWLMPKFVQMQSMSSPSSRCHEATASVTRSKSSLSTWNSSGMASPWPSVRNSMSHSNTMLKRRRK